MPATRTLFGLALSGGGIRSAALCLGVTQALNKHGVLRLTDYLSTVSGGGYLGCCLAANWWGMHNIRWSTDAAAFERWQKREKRGGADKYRPYWQDECPAPPESVADRTRLRWYFPFPHVAGVKETAMMRQLRGHADYLTPTGLAAVIRHWPALFVRGLVLNGLALAPILLLAAGLLGAWIDASSDAWLSSGWFDVSTPAEARGLAVHAAVILGLLLLLLYTISRPLRLGLEAAYGWVRRLRLNTKIKDIGAPPVDPVAADELLDIKWLARDKTRDLVDWSTIVLAGLAAFAAHPWLVWLVGTWLADPRVSSSTVGVAALSGVVGAIARQTGALPPGVRRAITIVALTIAGPLLLWICTVALSAWIGGILTSPNREMISWRPDLLTVSGVSFVLWLALTAWLYDCNEVALHAFYRDKLSRTFLFALHPLNRFWTIHVDDLKLSQMETSHAPYPIIGAALNMAGDQAQWSRGRKCDFFVFTPRFVGGPRTGYCLTAAMEDVNKRLRLASAMAISGAAFSAVAGRSTVGYARFLLALFNVRLGYWLPQPEAVVGKTRRKAFKSGPSRRFLGDRPGPAYFLAELTGRVQSRQRFVYLTDGGHIENMGLYELIRRRCRLIFVVDGEQDDTKAMRFESFADAIRFARIDFGVLIDIDLSQIRQDDRGFSKQSWAVGTVDYGNGAEGLIVYLKSSLTADVPEDVRKYRMADPLFPHQPTTDQFFDEEQFEAYRALGYHVGDRAMTELVDPNTRARLVRVQQS
ncbi:patatin-like phospholipase family protein [Vineibacter terrae]|uniref:patatin-like phospholipase family protein n=1 Tax=Vineibacter terrae TaxID=2586908 RepID=UPI0039C8E532